MTLLPCIKAFDAATNPGLIDITGLANEVDGKLDRVIDSKPVRYVIDAYNDGTNWYRKWSDGWLEQGGQTSKSNQAITLLKPYSGNDYTLVMTVSDAAAPSYGALVGAIPYVKTTTSFTPRIYYTNANIDSNCNWYTTGQGI